ncbi:MAG: hypothetical protein A2W25_11675 [candidate division Zixibacteria bacterium RBG_16_53_22]|nr:MAG: hypothetical protein A2W25_11675 [candidate division Zixibacteria bacterium RBG_16_53_22]
MIVFIKVSAGSGYGMCEAWYEMVEDHLIMRHAGDHDDLSGNSVACAFEGLTLTEAHEKRDAVNSEPVGHSFDGCHACYFHVDIDEDEDPPDFLTYQPSDEAEVIQAAIALRHKRITFSEFKKIVDNFSA